MHGTDDHIIRYDRGVALAELTGGELVLLRGRRPRAAGRYPVAFNLLLRDLVDRVSARPPAARRWVPSLARTRRALFVSSPIGLGHAWRDVAIADELRRAVPGLEIDGSRRRR